MNLLIKKLKLLNRNLYSTKANVNYLSKLSDNEVSNIIQNLRRMDVYQLVGTGCISEEDAYELTANRYIRDKFKSLNEFDEESNNFDNKQRFYDALKVDIPVLTKYNYDKFEMIPNLTSNALSKFNRISAIDVSIPFITYMNFDKYGVVHDWKSIEWNDLTEKKYDFNVYKNLIENMFGKELCINNSDAFIFEKRIYKYPQLKIAQKVIHVQKIELLVQSYLSYSLSEKSLFFIPSTKLARKLDLIVGSERISSTSLVKKLLEIKLKLEKGDFSTENENHDNHKIHNIFLLNTNNKISNEFLSMSDLKNQKEPLSRCYLLASCFLESIQNLLKQQK